MEVAKLGLIFCIIVVIIWLKYPLYLAMAAFPDEGLPFLAMLMGAVWAAMELSPTHVCAFVAADYYHTTFADLVAKTLPSGAGFYVNRLAAECDLLVTEGFIEPHFFAGFLGGRKSILPGICVEKTVNENHSFIAIFKNSAYQNGIFAICSLRMLLVHSKRKLL